MKDPSRAIPVEDPPRPPSPDVAELFRRWFLRATGHVLDELTSAGGSERVVYERFGFLRGYADELAANPWLRDAAPAAAELEKPYFPAFSAPPPHFPLAALCRAADLDAWDVLLLLTAGLTEEDVRFGALIEAVQGTPGQRRPCAGLLAAWYADIDAPPARDRLRRLLDLGLLEVLNPDAPRGEWALQVPALLWDALRGPPADAPTRRRSLAPWVALTPPGALPPLPSLILPLRTNFAPTSHPELLATGTVATVAIRGPHHNGRRTLAGALARSLGLGTLEITGLGRPDDPRLKLVGPLATLTGAAPVIVLDPAPGEIVPLPRPAAYAGPLFVILPRHGDFSGTAADRLLPIDLPTPGPAVRRLHWSASLPIDASPAPSEIDALAERFRFTSGHIRITAAAAAAYARLAGRSAVAPADVRLAARALHRQALDALAEPVPTPAGWECLAAPANVMRELKHLETRCRHREKLWDNLSPALAAQANTGVRALFNGPSGTGKTLAATALAAALDMPLYRLDLSTVVNKYIGETEKNLSRLFTLAEELDVILLLDEGDALLTQRTGVQTANDRYANLETNYLLQRVESYGGILLVTTNAGERIDSAFQRRMDVVVDFRPPDAAERLAIWQLQLPTDVADAAQSFLHEVAARCALTGGQIRNAVLHASLLALEDAGQMTPSHVEAAVRREYRKIGISCALRWREQESGCAAAPTGELVHE